MTKLKQWFQCYKHQLSLGVLVLGFVFDNIALRQADFPVVKLALLSYLGFLAVAIVLFNRYKFEWLLYLIQFAFGNLFSGFFILFFHSATWVVSWPFLALLFLAFLSSEFGKKHYLRLRFQLIVFYLALYSFFILFLPIALGELSARVFLLSGVVSVVVMGAFLAVLAWSTPKLFAQARQGLWWGIGGVLVLLNLFYFTNILPPIPLALKEAGVYHSIVRSGNDFVAQSEKLSWWQRFSPRSTLKLTAEESAYVYGAIFAPISISTQIVHHWQYYDEGESAWVTKGQINIAIVGGREAGYRSYSFLKDPLPGRWRVSIETARGQVIGRQGFTIERVGKIPPLLPVVL